jgi:hypothetical protein
MDDKIDKTIGDIAENKIGDDNKIDNEIDNEIVEAAEKIADYKIDDEKDNPKHNVAIKVRFFKDGDLIDGRFWVEDSSGRDIQRLTVPEDATEAEITETFEKTYQYEGEDKMDVRFIK